MKHFEVITVRPYALDDRVCVEIARKLMAAHNALDARTEKSVFRDCGIHCKRWRTKLRMDFF